MSSAWLAACPRERQQAERPDKFRETLRARTALLGGTLCWTTDDRGEPLYILTLCGWSRPMSSLEEAEAVIARAEGRR